MNVKRMHARWSIRQGHVNEHAVRCVRQRRITDSLAL
jgi:hypothetical protein